MDVEVTQGLRRLVRSGEVSATRAAEAIEDLGDFDLHRHAHLNLLTRAWQLRENVTAYDAMYVALPWPACGSSKVTSPSAKTVTVAMPECGCTGMLPARARMSASNRSRNTNGFSSSPRSD